MQPLDGSRLGQDAHVDVEVLQAAQRRRLGADGHRELQRRVRLPEVARQLQRNGRGHGAHAHQTDLQLVRALQELHRFGKGPSAALAAAARRKVRRLKGVMVR